MRRTYLVMIIFKKSKPGLLTFLFIELKNQLSFDQFNSTGNVFEVIKYKYIYSEAKSNLQNYGQRQQRD